MKNKMKHEVNVYANNSYGRVAVKKFSELPDAMTHGYITVGSKFRLAGMKDYELKDHLGNVRVLVNDIRPLGVPLRADIARVTAVRNYYPYGMLKAHKTTTDNYHRYGFNSMEMDNEAVIAGESGTGNSYTTLFRQYDPRLGRWLRREVELLTEF